MEEQTINTAEGAPQQKPSTESSELDFEALLGENEALRAAYERHVAGLKSALDKEREARRNLEAILRRLNVEREAESDDRGGSAQKQSAEAAEALQNELKEKEGRLAAIQEELANERIRGELLYAIAKAGVKKPDVVLALAMSSEVFPKLDIEDGKVKNADEIVQSIIEQLREVGRDALTPGVPQIASTTQSKNDNRRAVPTTTFTKF